MVYGANKAEALKLSNCKSPGCRECAQQEAVNIKVIHIRVISSYLRQLSLLFYCLKNNLL